MIFNLIVIKTITMKNKIGGSGAKKAKSYSLTTRELTFKDESQDYATVLTILGGGKMKVLCFGDNTERIASVRGTMRKKVWIVKEDIILVSLRDFQDSHCDIILKYTQDETRMLKSYDEIPNKTIGQTIEEDDIQFGEEFINNI
jgi:translation initiation factor 1A